MTHLTPAPVASPGIDQVVDMDAIRTALESRGHLRDLSPLPGADGRVVYYWLDFTPHDCEKVTGAVTFDELTQVAAGDYSVAEES